MRKRLAMASTRRRDHWRELASALVRDQIRKRGIANATLADLLSEHGMKQVSEKSLSRSLTTGAFSAAFLLQCLYALDVKALELPPMRTDEPGPGG